MLISTRQLKLLHSDVSFPADLFLGCFWYFKKVVGISDLRYFQCSEVYIWSITGDDEEDHDVHCLRRVDSPSNSAGLSTSGNSNVSPTGRVQKWFPYDDSFKLNEESTLTSSEVLSMLSPFLEDGRKQRIEEVVAHRTYSLSIVVEGLLDLGNISAVFRSADALGFQSVHVVSNETKKRSVSTI